MRGFKTVNEYSMALEDVYEKAPKAVIAAIAVSCLTTGGDHLSEAKRLFLKEWQTLYDNGIIPQKPPLETSRV